MTEPELIAACVDGISFSAEGAQKTHDGLKTHTMRLMKPQPEGPIYRLPGRAEYFYGRSEKNGYTDTMLSPRYKPGDILYVREPWAERCCLACQGVRLFDTFTGDGNQILCPEGRKMDSDGEGCVLYEALHASQELPAVNQSFPHVWRPAKTMPIEAARSFIRITEVKAKRPMDLTVEEIIAEGIVCPAIKEGGWCSFDCDNCKTIRDTWFQLIRSIYPPEQHGDNPWCWGYRYELLRCEG